MQGAEDTDIHSSWHWKMVSCCFWGFYNCGTHLRQRLVLHTLRGSFFYCLFMFPPRLFFLLVVKQGVRGSGVSKISAMLFLLMPKKRLQWRHYHIFRLPVCYWPLDFCPLTVRNKVLECKYACFPGHVLGEVARCFSFNLKFIASIS